MKKGLEVVDVKKVIRDGARKPTFGKVDVVTLGLPRRAEEVMALAIISACNGGSRIRVCGARSESELKRIRECNRNVWMLGAAGDGYDFNRHMYNHLSRAVWRPEHGYGLAGLLWRDYGEQICSRFCSVREQGMGVPQLVADRVRKLLTKDIDEAALPGHSGANSVMYFMLSTEFREMVGNYAVSREKSLREAFVSARVLLSNVIIEALDYVRTRGVIISPDGYARLTA